jgi:hypothetical protein
MSPKSQKKAKHPPNVSVTTRFAATSKGDGLRLLISNRRLAEAHYQQLDAAGHERQEFCSET